MDSSISSTLTFTYVMSDTFRKKSKEIILRIRMF